VKRTLPPLVIALSIVLAGCTTVAPEPAPTPTPTVAASGDGVLRIGTLFALTGDLKLQGAAEVAGVELAVRDINQAGGVNGALVEVFHRGGIDPAQAEESWAALTEKSVDIVVGPDSTEVASVVVPLSAAAGIPLVSASSPTGDAVMSFSVASASTPAESLAGAIVDSGAQSVFAITNDSADLGTALEAAGGTLVGSAPVANGQTDFTELLAAADGATAVVVDSKPTKAVSGAITALRASGIAADGFWFVGDGLRDWSETLPVDSITNSYGFAAGAVADAATTKLLRQTDPGVKDTRHAVEAYDAVILAALAATLAGDDGGPSIASRLRAASADGIPCSSYGECLDVLTTQTDINYQGLSGAIDLGDAGSPVSSSFTLYRYSDENAPVVVVE
jgi:branched-chain amino acid transport system substrate-binding protein